MADNAQARFDARAEEWAQYYRTPLGRIRHEVLWSNLALHLPDLGTAEEPPRILEAGGGTGELAIQLVKSGYLVCLLDYAPAMLDHARQAAQSLPQGTDSRLEFALGSVQDAANMFAPASFDAITCHTLVDYLPEPQETLAAFLPLLREGGLLSLSFVNHHSEVLRQVIENHDPAVALEKLHERFHRTGLFEVSGQAYRLEEAEAWLADLDLTICARYGVRYFADFLEPELLRDPAFLESLIELEKAVAGLAPYRLLARYVHFIAHRSVGREH